MTETLGTYDVAPNRCHCDADWKIGWSEPYSAQASIECTACGQWIMQKEAVARWNAQRAALHFPPDWSEQVPLLTPVPVEWPDSTDHVAVLLAELRSSGRPLHVAAASEIERLRAELAERTQAWEEIRVSGEAMMNERDMALDSMMRVGRERDAMQVELAQVSRLAERQMIELTKLTNADRVMRAELAELKARNDVLQSELDGHMGCCIAHGRYKPIYEQADGTRPTDMTTRDR